MAIDRGDAIRRPLDSTLSTRPIHRGGDGVVQLPAQALEQLRQSSPAIAVVVEQTNLGTQQKPLFELLLQLNNQWVRARSDRPFEAGTVLLVEAAQGNEIKVLPNPDAQQLNRMIQASLSFWQAHTLPRVQATQLPPMPKPEVLAQLAIEQPALKPLVNWLNQRPPLNAKTVAQWMQEFQPLPQAMGRSPLPAPSSGTDWVRPSTTQAAEAPPPASGTQIPSIASAPLTLAVKQAVARLTMGIPGGTSHPAPIQTLVLPAAGQPGNSTQSAVAPLTNTVVNTASPNSSATQPIPPQTMAPVVNQLQSAPNALQPSPTLLIPEAAATNTKHTPVTQQWQPLPQPNATEGRIPIEVRLAQWIDILNQRISQHPASLQQSLAQKAQQILNTHSTGYPATASSPTPNAAGGVAQTEALQPLLQLRNALDAVQGKTQNNAIQQALGNMNQPDLPPVQQLSIPLIWLGPSAWMNMEWWQERRKEETGKDDATKGKRLWRFRLFFELEPLAPLCADLVWEPEQTDLTFWCEDKNTLAFLNQNIDTLQTWTEGLGERQLHTRHGMPKKKTTPNPDEFKPLVDVRT